MPRIFHLFKDAYLMQFLSLDKAVSFAVHSQMVPWLLQQWALKLQEALFRGDVLIEQSTSNLSLLSKYLLVMITLILLL